MYEWNIYRIIKASHILKREKRTRQDGTIKRHKHALGKPEESTTAACKHAAEPPPAAAAAASTRPSQIMCHVYAVTQRPILVR